MYTWNKAQGSCWLVAVAVVPPGRGRARPLRPDPARGRLRLRHGHRRRARGRRVHEADTTAGGRPALHDLSGEPRVQVVSTYGYLNYQETRG